MSKKILKELLKSPFSLDKDKLYIIDKNGWVLFAIGCPPILADNGFREFVEQALNEKWERDFGEPLDKLHPHIHCPQYSYPIYKSDFDVREDGEPMRWIHHEPKHVFQIGSLYECPKCHSLQVRETDFCPGCGQGLRPSEGK